MAIPSDLEDEIDKAFANVDLALRTAGGKGWSQVSPPFPNHLHPNTPRARLIPLQVYKVRSYHVTLDNSVLGAMVRNLKKWTPDNDTAPLWTVVGVTRLGEEAMRVEIEVEAYDPK